MSTDNRSFIFNLDWMEVLKDYPKEVRYEVLDAIIGYAQSGEVHGLSPIAGIIFMFIMREMDFNKNHTHPCGKRHWNWKGGVSNRNHSIRESSVYKKWRKAVFERDGYRCQCCGKRGGKLNAHHIKPFSLFPESRFDINNGITLCKKCHIELHKTERLWVKKVF